MRINRIGHLVYSGDALKIDSNGSWIVLGTVNQEFKPEYPPHFSIRVTQSITASGMLGTDGKINYYASAASTSRTNFQFCVTYITL